MRDFLLVNRKTVERSCMSYGIRTYWWLQSFSANFCCKKKLINLSCLSQLHVHCTIIIESPIWSCYQFVKGFRCNWNVLRFSFPPVKHRFKIYFSKTWLKTDFNYEKWSLFVWLFKHKRIHFAQFDLCYQINLNCVPWMQFAMYSHFRFEYLNSTNCLSFIFFLKESCKIVFLCIKLRIVRQLLFLLNNISWNNSWTSSK